MLQDKVGTAKKIDSLLSKIIASGDFRLKYRITVNPPPPPGGVDGEQPVILGELAGPDSSLLLEGGAEMLRALVTVAHEAGRLFAEAPDEIRFGWRSVRAG